MQEAYTIKISQERGIRKKVNDQINETRAKEELEAPITSQSFWVIQLILRSRISADL